MKFDLLEDLLAFLFCTNDEKAENPPHEDEKEDENPEQEDDERDSG